MCDLHSILQSPFSKQFTRDNASAELYHNKGAMVTGREMKMWCKAVTTFTSNPFRISHIGKTEHKVTPHEGYSIISLPTLFNLHLSKSLSLTSSLQELLKF